MNTKKTACVVLLIIVAVFVYLVQIMHQKAADRQAQADATEGEAFAAQTERDQADIRVQTTKVNSEPLRKFLTTWRAPVDRIQTQTEVEEAIQSSLRMNGLVVISQRFEKRDMDQNPVLPRIIKATLVIQDDYAKTLNWVGDLERRIPLCRINSCRITGAEEARQVHTEVTLEVPLINLKAETAKS